MQVSELTREMVKSKVHVHAHVIMWLRLEEH